jgi:CheY-like chemotaxis protein
LIVDDDSNSRELLSSLFSAHGIAVDSCDDSAKVPSLLINASQAGRAYSLVLLDLMMPGLDGMTLARELRRMPVFDSLRLVACSASNDELVANDVAKHFSFVTRKPLSQEAVRKILDEACVRLDTDPVNVLAGARVLVIDDNTINRVMVMRMLQKRKVEVMEAENGEIGCQLAETGRYDAVLMDQSMPVLDGIEATRRLRLNPITQDLPIIGFSADTSDRSDRVMLDAGVSALLHKPVQIEELVNVLRTLICKYKETKDASDVQGKQK